MRIGAAESGECTISNSDVTMGVKGETFQISLRDANGDKITGLLWVSSDVSVCSVDGTGVVKAEGKRHSLRFHDLQRHQLPVHRPLQH